MTGLKMISSTLNGRSILNLSMLTKLRAGNAAVRCAPRTALLEAACLNACDEAAIHPDHGARDIRRTRAREKGNGIRIFLRLAVTAGRDGRGAFRDDIGHGAALAFCLLL